MIKHFFLLTLIINSSVLSAQTYSSTTVVAIPDGTGLCGRSGAPGISTINVPITGTITSPTDVTININMDHTHVGDLAIALVTPDLSSCYLINHLDATICIGSWVKLDMTNTLSFNAAYTTTISTGVDPIPTGDYAPTGSTRYTNICNLTKFLTGKSINGDWSIVATDNYSGNIGHIDSWSIVFSSTSLPLQLLNFNGNSFNGYNTIQWQTGSEKGIDYIEIERSTNAILWDKLTRIQAEGSNSNYYYVDNQLENNSTVFYRIKIVDLDGNYTYSKTIRLANSIVNTEKTILNPNPTKSVITLKVGDQSLIGQKAKLVNHMGMFLQSIDIANAIQQIDVSKYPASVYIILLSNGECIRFIKQD